MKLRAIALCAAALFLPLTAACSDGDSDGGKTGGSDQNITVGGSTVAELSEQLQASGVPKEQADCLAQAYEKLDLDADELQKLQEGDTSVLDAKDLTSYARVAGECLSK